MPTPDHAHADPLDDTTATVLRMSIVRGQRAIDRLLDLLATPPAPGIDTFGSLVQDRWPADFPPARALVDSSPGVEPLIRLKDSGKRRAAGAARDIERMQGAARYALAVAAALTHHGVSITSMHRQELHPVLLDFAELTGAPWSRLFDAAARRCAVVGGDAAGSEARDG